MDYLYLVESTGYNMSSLGLFPRFDLESYRIEKEIEERLFEEELQRSSQRNLEKLERAGKEPETMEGSVSPQKSSKIPIGKQSEISSDSKPVEKSLDDYVFQMLSAEDLLNTSKSFIQKEDSTNVMEEKNNVSVEGATHKQVVDLIKSGGDCLTLTVISVTPQEAERLEPQEDPGGYSYIDYSEKRSLPISIPDYNIVTRNGERFIVFNIHMAGRQLCSRRYREFANLHSVLRKEFVGFNFPKLPGKWPFQLSEQQLDARRRGLEQYLEKVCAVRVIAESDAVQDFLTDSEDDLSASPVDIKIMLPDHEVATVSVKKSASAQAVWDLLVQRANFTSYTQQYFYLFEIVEYNFERKLQPHEIPHQLYVQNYSTASSTCLCIRRWLFSVSRELQLPDGEQAAKFIFYQAVDEVNRGNIRADGRLYELKALQDAKRASEYLALARTLPGYGDVVFPHCSCDSRKEGHVVPIVGTKSFRLHACREDGALEAQMVELTWDTITRWESDDEAMAFCFQYTRNEKSPRWVKVYTPYHAYLADCFDRIMEERKWDDSGD